MSQTKAQLIDPVDGTIVNADINASAAIAGSKVSPDFGSQNITTTGIVKIADGSVSAPAIAFTDDLDTGIFSVAQNTINVTTGGVERLEIGTSLTVFNDGGADVDFRIEGDTDANLFKVDAGNDRIGIGISAPQQKLHIAVSDSGAANIVFTNSTTGSASSDGLVIGLTGAEDGQINMQESANLMFSTAATERMRIDSSGNVGIGITPDSHHSTVTSLQIGDSTNLYDDSNFVILANNVYFDGTSNKRIKADEASRIIQEAGKFFFERAGADSADSAITFQRIIATNEDGTIFLKGQATNDNNRMQVRVDDTLATFMSSSNSSTERNIAFHTRNTSGSLAGTFTANGLAMPSGKGIDFAADGSASGMEGELLNDYEEGVFTATNSIGSTVTENFPSRYVKVGNLCYIMMDVSFSGASDVSQTGLIQGLPFTSQNLTNGEQSIGYPFISETSSSARDADESNTVFFIGKNESRLDIYNLAGGHIQTRSFLTGRRFRMNFCYRTA